MEIDIIEMTDEEFSELTKVQQAMVTSAQAQKNSILLKAEQKKEELLEKLLDRNISRTSLKEAYALSVDGEANAEIDVLREDLLYRLAYESKYSDGNEFGPYRYPENPNYNLNAPQRFLVVRDYYMHVTSNAEARLQAYAMDSLAVEYLGEYYQTLYDLLASYIK